MNVSKFAMLALAMALAFSCKESNQGQRVSGNYPLMKVSLSEKTLEHEYPATLQGRQNVEIRPQVGGIITKILINEGARVSRGQTLFIIDQVPYQAALKTAQANVKSAEVKVSSARLALDSKKKLHESQVISTYDLQMAQNSLSEAEASLALAQAQEVNAANNLSYTVVKSPVNGVAGMIPYREGALVNSNIQEPLVTVTDNSEIFAYFSMNEKQFLQMSKMHPGMEFGEAGFIMSDDSRYPEAGKIDAVSGMVDPSTGSVVLKAVFPNPDRLLLSGASGKVVLPTVREGCIVIPKSSTFEIQDKIFVYKVIDGKAVSTRINVMPISDGKEYIVEEGLAEGDEIISDGAGLVREGASVKASNQ